LAHELVGAKKKEVMPFEVVLDTTLTRVTLVAGKGALGTWWSQYGQRRKSDEPCLFRDELRGKPTRVGGVRERALKLHRLGKASRGEPRSKPESGNPTFRESVQERLECSVGDRPTEAKVRSLVAWIAEKRKTESLKPIDKAIYRMVSKPSGRNESERRSSLEKSKPQRSSTFPEGEGSMDRRKLTDVAVHSGGVKATARWQGRAKQDTISNWRDPPRPDAKAAEKEPV
jgi:hypothetical protein